MASSTPCLRGLQPPLAETGRRWPVWVCALILAVASLLLCLAPARPAKADVGAAEVTQLTVERSDEGVFLNASLRLDLPGVVRDAMLKGIPIHFVVEADLYRERWYWADRKVASAVRHMRLSYQALSRRWRLQSSPQPIGNAGQGVAYAQQFDSLEELISVMQRINRWQIGAADDVDAQARHILDFRFRLDVSLLPRPVQFGVAGQSEWALNASRTQRVVVEAQK